MNSRIALLKKGDCELIEEEFRKQNWNKPKEQYLSYWQEQKTNQRLILVYWLDGQFAGYLTIRWESYDPYFRENHIPEIMDLNVLEKFQGRGVASALMDEAETIVFENHDKIGIGVGLTGNYGKAQRLYVKRNYIPDGRGISSNETPVPYLSIVTADDDLVLTLIKER